MKIKKATAVYTGGGIWLFYGKIKNGNYFLMDDNGYVVILNKNPKNLDESTYEEWQKLHMVEELVGEKRIKFANKVLDYLIDNPKHRGGMVKEEIEIYREWVIKE